MKSLSNDDVYKEMLERLEINVIHVEKLNNEVRLDAEYFLKENIYMDNKLRNMPHVRIGEFAVVTDGIHTSIDYDADSKINLISATSPRENVFDLSRRAFISEKAHRANRRTALRENDVVLSTVGTIGNCAVVNKNILPANADRHVAIIRQSKDINPYFLSTFLLTKYGKNQTLREATGNVQLNLFLYKVKEIKVPLLSNKFQLAIESTVKKALKYLREAEDLYRYAEKMLLNDLGLTEYIPSREQNSVRSYRDVLKTGRIDAEYYQPKYDDFEQVIKGYKKGFTTPGNTFELIKTKCSKDLPEYSYVEIGDVDIGNGRAEYNVVPIDELPDNAKIMTQAGDLLVSTVRPYRGAVAILKENNYLVSGAFTVLRERGGYPAETLQVLFRTPIYKDWLLKFNVGTSYPVIKDEDVLNIPIPIFEDDIHDKVRKCIRESHSMISHSKELLETAKCAVEIAIEQDEKMAIKYLEDNLQLK